MALSAGCGPLPDDQEGLLGTGRVDPFPSMLLIGEDGRLDLRAEDFPADVPGELSSWRRGFSPAGTAVVRLPGVDPSALPGWRAPTPGEGGVRLLDLETGTWLPIFAELDAWPDQEPPSLLLRPRIGLPVGHRVAWIITTEAAPRAERFTQLLSRRPPASIAHLADGTREMVEAIAEAGLPEDQVAFAWQAPIDDGIEPTRSMLRNARKADVSWSFSDVRPGQAGGLRTAEGVVTVTGFLDPEGWLRPDASGDVAPTGTWTTDLFVFVPASLAGAPAGSAPIVVFGHGIFGEPGFYLGGQGQSDVTALLETCGCIGVGTSWRGLSRSDLTLALSAANDFSTLPRIPAALAQSQVVVRALAEAAVSGELGKDPVFAADDGGSLAKPGRVVYYGISLGGIEGGVATGLGAPFSAAVLHVPGSQWSTMLERSSNFPVLEDRVVIATPDPWARQVLYAWSQLHWDLADPLLVAQDLRDGPPVLLQEALYDDQVPNMTTRSLALTAGFPAVGPVVEAPWGLEVSDAPRDGSAWVQYDAQKAPPPEGNRPAPKTGAHDQPRLFPGHPKQTLTFLSAASEGRVIHPCGDAPCTAENPGN